MKYHPKLGNEDAAIVARRNPGVCPTLSKGSLTSANDNQGYWTPPLTELLPSNSSRLQQISTENDRLFFLCKEANAQEGHADAGFRSSQWEVLGGVAYLIAISIAMFGWVYLLWSILNISLKRMLG